MMDQEQQARILRERLDAELASVHATAEARQRLWQRAGGEAVEPANRPATGRAVNGHSLNGHELLRRRPGPGERRRRFVSGLAVPVAATAIVVSVIAVPTLLRANSGPDDRDGTPAGPAGPAASAPAAPIPAPAPTGTGARQTRPSQTRPSGSEPDDARTGARATTKPSSSGELPSAAETARKSRATGESTAETSVTIRTGQTVTVTVTGEPTLTGDLAIRWGDGTEPWAAEAECTRKTTRNTRTVSHDYTEAGRYRVVASVGGCGSSGPVRLRIEVGPAAAGR